MKFGVLVSRIRVEEKLLFEELNKRGVEFDRIYDSEIIFRLEEKPFEYDVILERSLHHGRALYALKVLNDWGIPTVNTYEVAQTCGSKFLTTQAIIHHGIPTPRTTLSFTPDSTIKAIEEMGYPVVIKPSVGSWGRLLAKINDREAAEAVLEHKETLGNYEHSIFYVQEYIKKPQRDIRAFVVGDETICAIYRGSQHWITNTARGGEASNCPVTPELNDLCVRAAKAVGGGVVAIDVFEDADRGLLVNEVNYTMEFRNSIDTTGVNIPGRVIDYCLQLAKSRR
jgi:[lysine-biosynthesis-protein LysW]---L-2-aminoadipate ligase